jgi:hypothetical protein
MSGELHRGAVKAIIMKVPAGGRTLWAAEHRNALYVLLGSRDGLRHALQVTASSAEGAV